MTMADIRVEGKAGRLSAAMTATVVDGQRGKEYRLPTHREVKMANIDDGVINEAFVDIPFGIPRETLPTADRHRAVGSQLPGYGFATWEQLFTRRQLLSLGQLTRATRASLDQRRLCGYPEDWSVAIEQYLSLIIDKVADYGSVLATWIIGLEAIRGTFARFAFSWTWDFCETNPIGDTAGCYSGALDWTVMALSHIQLAAMHGSGSHVFRQSALSLNVGGSFDLVVTDPPYYDAIPYADLMDFFHVWMRRASCRGEDSQGVLSLHLSPNWDSESSDGELIDDPGAYGGDRKRSKQAYEDGMARVFAKCGELLSPTGALVVVFAHKHPDAWETLVSAIIRAGFIADGSWPIQTERGVRTNAITTASLASSVWLVCKKRPPTAKPGWDNQVLDDMRTNIRDMLREFWDAGIRGPDFVWAATGPAMEAYSKHPVVKKANEPGPMTVSEFLTHVRRIVVDFVVGRVLSGDKEGDADSAAADRLDEVTAYYLLHRHDFGMDEAPAGACILYAVSCGISDRELAQTWDVIGFTKGKGKDDEDEEADADAEADPETEDDSGSKVKLKTWAQRKGKSLGYEAPGGKPIPLIDRVHRLMHLWKAGDLSKVDEYIDSNGLRRQELFKRLLQSLIELSPHGSEERSLMESISNHVGARGAVKEDLQRRLFDV